MKQSRLQRFRPSFRNLVLIFLFFIILEKQQPLFANLDKVATVVGLASDLYSGHMALDGKTVVSPALVVHSWRKDYYGYYKNRPFSAKHRITRIPFTGDYIYEFRQLQSNGTYSVSKDVFTVEHLCRRNYRCDSSVPAFEWVPAQKHIYNVLEDFVVALYHASPPAKTGGTVQVYCSHGRCESSKHLQSGRSVVRRG